MLSTEFLKKSFDTVLSNIAPQAQQSEQEDPCFGVINLPPKADDEEEEEEKKKEDSDEDEYYYYRKDVVGPGRDEQGHVYNDTDKFHTCICPPPTT